MNLIDRQTPAGTLLYPPTVTSPERPLPLLPFLFRFVRNPLRTLARQVYEKPLVAFHDRNIAWVTDPALVEQILRVRPQDFPKTPLEQRVFRDSLGQGILTSSGATWRWQRRTAAPLFRQQEILRYVPTMAEAAAKQLERWRAAPAGTVQPIDRQMSATTFEVISRTMLDGGNVAEASEIQDAATDLLERITWEVAFALLNLPTWLWHPGKATMRRGALRLRAAVAAIVQRRRSTGGGSDDLLGRLLAARDPETGAPMSDDALIDNLLTFLAAGHETTAKALSWTLYLVARAPDWQQRVRQEVDVVAGRAAVAAEHLPKLALTQQVLKESMRLYPPAAMLSRVAGSDVELGDCRISAGTLLVIPTFAIHRHRMLWENPDAFDPTRFAPEREAQLPRTQYMPFGAGPRICIGASFALTEATVILATLVREARFDWDGRHLPEPVSRVTLRPRGGMPLNVFPLA